MPDTAAALHQLHLFLILLHDGAIGVCISLQANDEAVAQRGNLMIISDTRHGASCGDDISKVVQ